MDAATSGAAPSRVLVIGASGGVGSYAVQLAVAAGAHVTKAFPLARAGEAIDDLASGQVSGKAVIAV